MTEPLAFDLSQRWKDQDGHLHVRVSNLSKATVNPYRGEEIPNWQALGLDPQRIYQLLRDPEELTKAAATFNNIRLMSRHVAVSATDPHEKEVAGSTGTDARFEAPYLVNSLVIWRQEDIDDVESREKCELSCGYYYEPDMSPGEYHGLRYDGVMRNIRANHVALVGAGRAGPDVQVHDQRETPMPATPLASRKALLVKGALASFLRPKLLPGVTLALDQALGGVNRLNWVTEKPKVIASVIELASAKLAKDANLDDLKMAMDAMDKEEDGEAKDDEVGGMDEEEETPAEKEAREAREKEAKDKRAKDKKARDAKAAKDKKAKDADPDDDDDDDDDKKDKGMDKAAMDAAIAAAKVDIVASMNAAVEAREIVRPLVGQVALALDSAEAIFKFALDAHKVETKGVHPSAYKAMVGMIPKPGIKVDLALDAAPATALHTRFPNLARFGHV